MGASGGKDSTVLVHVLNKLNKEKDLGVKLVMVAVDEGIRGYRDDSLACLKRNQELEQLELVIVDYQSLYGWTMDQIVAQIGTSRNCTYCGILRRQALEIGAVRAGCSKVATGHNADDLAETVLLNLVRGDFKRLAVSARALTGDQDEEGWALPRIRPFQQSFQK